MQEELSRVPFHACGIVTIHSDGVSWEVDETFTIEEDGAYGLPYEVKSGETFNVMWTEASPTVFMFQPQTATNVLIPFEDTFVEEYKEMWAALNGKPGVPQVGMDVLVWHPTDKRPLVDIE